MGFYKVNSGDVPQASDVNQFADGFQGNGDFGTLRLADHISAPSAAPTATVVSGSGLGVGAYQYAYTYVTGYKKSNGTFVYTGETTLSPVANVTTTSGNQKVNLTNIATSSATYVIARRIYRTKVGGSTFYRVAEISDNTTTTYTDTTADASLTITAPSSNTTGTGFSKLNITNDGLRSIKDAGGGHLIIEHTGGYVMNNGAWASYLNANAYWDGTNWYRYDTSQPASALVINKASEPTFRSIGSGTGPITWNQYTIFHEGNFTTRTHVLAYASAQQTLVVSSWNRVKFNTKVYDYLNEFDTTNWYFTALNTGIYMVSFGVRLINALQNPNIMLGTNQLNRAGNSYNVFEDHTNAQTVQYFCTQVLYMNAGTQLECRVWQDGGNGAATIDTGQNYTWLNISRVA